MPGSAQSNEKVVKYRNGFKTFFNSGFDLPLTRYTDGGKTATTIHWYLCKPTLGIINKGLLIFQEPSQN